MISVADVARELHLPDREVLGACHDLGIVASSTASGLSSTEHRQLRTHFGGDDDELGAVPKGSTDRRPGEHEPHRGEGSDPHGTDDIDVDGPPAVPAGHHHHAHQHTHQHEDTPGTWDTVVAERKAARKRTPIGEARLPAPRGFGSRTVVRVTVLAFGVIAVGISLFGLSKRADDAAGASCVDFVDDGADMVPTDCEGPHDAEVVGAIEVGEPDGPRPAADALLARAEAECPTGDDVEGSDSELVRVYRVPTVSSWAEGDRTVVCLLEDPSAPLVGPLDRP